MVSLTSFPCHDNNNLRETAVSPINFVTDNVGYTEMTFYADDAEMLVMQTALNKALLPLLTNDGEGNGRRKCKIAIILHPEDE